MTANEWIDSALLINLTDEYSDGSPAYDGCHSRAPDIETVLSTNAFYVQAGSQILVTGMSPEERAETCPQLDAATWCESYSDVPYIDVHHCPVRLCETPLRSIGHEWDGGDTAIYTFADIDDTRRAFCEADDDE